MTVAGGPKIETDGLVLYYDVNNIDSYPGEPTTNDITYPDLSNVSDATSGTTTRTKTTFDNGKVGVLFTQPSWDILTLTITHGATPTSGETYTFSAWMHSTKSGNLLKQQIKVTVDGVVNWLQNDETWSTSVNEYGEFISATTTNAWHRVTKTITFPVGTLTTFLIGSAYRATSAFVLKIAEVQFEAKAHATQFLWGTRSSTDGLKDLSGQGNHAELANATYDSNALIDYDGVSGYSTISDSSTLDIQGAMSIGAWIKLDTLTTTPSDPAIYARYDGTTAGTRQFWFSYRNAGSDKGIALYVVDSSNVLRGAYRTDWSPSIDTWYYIMGVFSPSNYMRIYINSVLDYEITTSIPADVHSTSIDSYIGAAPNYSTGYHFDGKIDLVQQYNQALTSQEILNNYNAQKSRFGH